METTSMSALALGKNICAGHIGCVEAVQEMLGRIQEMQPETNAYITLCGQQALEQADKVQRGIREGKLASPLAGVPIAIKDNICTKGIRTSCASRMLADYAPPYSAAVVQRLEAAGMLVLGKLNMDEFAMGTTNETSYFGPVHNPHAKGRSPGGSSGGAAAAVAAGMAPCALGSDTGGSIRQPAAHCGVVGFKPSYGAVSRYGLVAHASSLDQIGPMGKDVADCAALMDIIAGRDVRDASSHDAAGTGFLAALADVDVSGLRIALPRECFDAREVSAQVSGAVMQMAEKLQAKGARLGWVRLRGLAQLSAAYCAISCAEAASNLARFDGVRYGLRSGGESLGDMYAKTRGSGFGYEVKKRVLLGTLLLSGGKTEAYAQAQAAREDIRRQLEEIFLHHDLLLCPTTPTTAPPLGGAPRAQQEDIFTAPASMAGLPALSVPCGFDDEGLPVGAQIIAPAGADARALALGHFWAGEF